MGWLVLRASAILQLQLIRRSPTDLIAFVSTPLTTVALLAILKHANRLDIGSYAVLGPSMTALWSLTLMTSVQVIEGERVNGTLELFLATPAILIESVLGRLAAVVVLSELSLLEAVAVARLGFGVTISIAHIALFMLSLLLTALAMLATATALSCIFVLTRSARLYQNSLTYPIYLLGGAVVPVAFLPDWLRPVSRLIFLSWGSDAIRSTLSEGRSTDDVALQLFMTTLLGAVAYLAGHAGMRVVLRRVRRSGEVTLP